MGGSDVGPLRQFGGQKPGMGGHFLAGADVCAGAIGPDSGLSRQFGDSRNSKLVRWVTVVRGLNSKTV